MGMLTVTGRGLETVPTTIVKVRLGVEMQGRTASRVQQLVAQRSAGVVSFLQSQQVEHLETTGISLHPTYHYESDRSQTSGFMGTNLISFQTTPDKVGGLLDQAVEAGATRIDQIDWIASEEAVKKARDHALQQATQDALVQSRAVLDTLQFTQGEITNIEVKGAGSPLRSRMRAKMPGPPEATLTSALSREQQVQVEVTLQISY